MIKLYSYLLLISSLISNQLYSQANEKSLLWKVEGEDISPSYVYGTIHLIPEEDFSISESLQLALKNTDKLVMEINLDDASNTQQMMSMMYIEEGKTLADFISEKEYAELEMLFNEKIGMPLESMKNLKPFALNSLAMSMWMKDQSAKSYENELMNIAKENNKKIEGLESVAFQVSLFDKIDYKSQLIDLIEMLRKPEESMQIYYEMVENYKKQDIEALLEVFQKFQSNSLNDEILEELIDNRNRNWAEQFGEVCKEEKCFMAVGAGHLAGENGFINLLKQKGYTVSPVL